MKMLNLNEDDNLNTLSLDERTNIWIPQVVFYNTEAKRETLNDGKAYATVSRRGSYTRESDTSLQSAYLYKGRENPITLSRVYSARFLCEYDMGIYPFDIQICSATFTMKGNTGNFIHLAPSNISYLGPIDLPQYFVKGTRIKEVEVPPRLQAVQVDIVFGRRILSTILSTYLPTILIVIVSFSTNYFHGFFFEAIVTVNLTSLLVLTTLFISVSNSLPQTAYVKFIDVWLIFCLTMPFCEVLLQVIKTQLT